MSIRIAAVGHIHGRGGAGRAREREGDCIDVSGGSRGSGN